MEIKEIVDINQLKHYERNPRIVKKTDIERLKKQITRLGVYKPLLIDQNNVVLGGNQRLHALKALGHKEVWVSRVEPKTEAERLEYVISDNDAIGVTDEQLLAELITEHGQFDLEIYKYLEDSGKTIQELLNKFGPDPIEDEPPAVEEDAISKRGEIYQLGRHRLMCGDATSKEDVEALMDGKKADMVFTDPPYNIDFGYKEYKDTKTLQEYRDFCESWFAIYSKYPLVFTPGPRNVGLYPEPKDIGMWVKRGGKSGATVFNLRYCEPILFYGDFSKKRTTDLFEYNMEGMSSLNSFRQSSGIETKRDSREYAPAKPVKLIVDIVKSYSNEKNIIADCFGGNGTTLIACEQTNRICYMMEIDPGYCDVIRKRYAKFINKEDEWQKITPLINR